MELFVDFLQRNLRRAVLSQASIDLDLVAIAILWSDNPIETVYQAKGLTQALLPPTATLWLVICSLTADLTFLKQHVNIKLGLLLSPETGVELSSFSILFLALLLHRLNTYLL